MFSDIGDRAWPVIDSLKFVLDSRYFALFPNAGDLNGTGVENRGQMSDFIPPSPSVKIRGRTGECD